MVYYVYIRKEGDVLNELAKRIDNYISCRGVKKSWIADQLGISQQLLNGLLNKKNFTVDDANKILAPLGQQITICIDPLPDPQLDLKSPIYFLDDENTEK